MCPLFRMLRLCNAVGVAPAFPWIHPPLWMLRRCNAVGVALIFQWNLSTLQMRSPRNSVRVVLLIARGWRGTSLPRVNVRKEIQRRRCWAFSVKAHLQWNFLWRINQKSATPMALFHAQYTLTQGSLHYRLVTLGYQKRNTDGVEIFIL